MRWCCFLGLIGIVAVAHASAPAAKKKPATTTTQARKSATTASNPKSRKTGRHVARKPAGPSYQQHPDPQRYAEIQRALADRGYFHGAADGEWKDDSVDALKRFQADQKLPDDGKISALTLTGLGLGPHHDGSTAAAVPLSTAPAAEPPVSGSEIGPASSVPTKKDQAEAPAPPLGQPPPQE